MRSVAPGRPDHGGVGGAHPRADGRPGIRVRTQLLAKGGCASPRQGVPWLFVNRLRPVSRVPVRPKRPAKTARCRSWAGTVADHRPVQRSTSRDLHCTYIDGAAAVCCRMFLRRCGKIYIQWHSDRRLLGNSPPRGLWVRCYPIPFPCPDRLVPFLSVARSCTGRLPSAVCASPPGWVMACWPGQRSCRGRKRRTMPGQPIRLTGPSPGPTGRLVQRPVARLPTERSIRGTLSTSTRPPSRR